MPRTVWWEDGQIKMIDQRVLPLIFEVVSYTRHEDVAVAIREMVVRGAPAIGAAGAFGMALRDSPHKGALTLADVSAWGRDGLGSDAGGYRSEFLGLIDKARALQ